MLTGIRVVDFTRLLPGPFATKLLADMGAEVIKVETPEGDESRQGPGGEGNPVFAAINGGKKSVTLNLKTPEAQQLAQKLVATADVVIEGFRPGVADRLGIGYEQLRQVKPDLIYCSLTGYGQSGEWSRLAGHDLNYIAVSGALYLTGPYGGPPVIPGLTIADLSGGMGAVQAILAALVQRSRTGKGAYLDVAMVDVVLQWMAFNRAQIALAPQMGERGTMTLNGGLACYQVYQAKEGYVALAALEYKFWESFCKGVGREDWLALHRSPARKGDKLFDGLTELFLTRTATEWEALGKEWDCCLTAVWSPQEMNQHPLVARWDAEHPPKPVRRLGEDNEAVFTALGCTAEELERWKEQGAI